MNEERTFSIKAIILGWSVDIIGQSIIMGIVIPLAAGIAFWLYLPATGTSPEQSKELAERWSGSIGFQIMDIVGSLLPPLLGGYVAARVAKTSELLHAFVVGLLSVLTAISFALMIPLLGWTELKWVWSDLIYWFLFIPSALLGGYLRTAAMKRSV